MRPLLRKPQEGIALTEALIALVLFALGILGFLAFRMIAVKEVTESYIRTSASNLASSLVAEMWVNRPNLAAYDSASGQDPAPQWSAQVVRELPGAGDVPPVITVDAASREVTIVMRWKQRNELRQYRVTTRVSDP